MSRAVAVFALAAGVGLAVPQAASAAPTVHSAASKPVAGAKCATLKATAKVGKSALVCKKNALGTAVWTATKQAAVKIVSAPIISPAPAAIPAPTPTPTSTPAGSVTGVVIDPTAGGSTDVNYGDPVANEQPTNTAPAAVTNVTLTAVSDTTADVSFTPIAGVENYQVYIRYDDSYQQTGATSTNPQGHFRDLTPDWHYNACVFYFGANNVTSNYACVPVHTTGSRPVEPVQPAGPAQISLSSTETTITASWTAVPGAAWYSLCHVRGDSWQCGGYTMLTDTSAIFQDGSIYPGWRYGVTVTAVFADGSRSLASMAYVYSQGSQPAPPTKYAAPTNLHITAISPTSVSIAWDDPANSPVTVWSVVLRHLTSYTATGVDPAVHEFTSDGVIWAGAGFEIILSGYDSVNGKWTEETKLGFFAPNS